MTQTTKAILFSSLGILSLLTSSIFTMAPSGLNVHSGEIIIYVFLLLTGFLVAPFFFFLMALRIARSFEGEEEQLLAHKLAILPTAILGVALGAVILGIIWITVVPQ